MRKNIQIKLHYKILASFFIIILITFGAIFLANHLFRKNFDDYLKKQHISRIDTVVEMFEGLETIDETQIEKITKLVQGYNMHISLVFEDGREVGLSQKEIKPNYANNEATSNKEFIKKNIKVVLENGKEIEVKIEYYDRPPFNNNDKVLIKDFLQLNYYILILIIFAVVLVSLYVAKGITIPIERVCKTTNDIRSGKLSSRSKVKTSTKELYKLSESVNYMAETLEKEDMLRKQLTSDMAHEIRTPVTVLRNFFEGFIDGVLPIDEDNINKCNNQILRMSELVEKLKDVATIEEGFIKPDNQLFNLSDEIISICDIFDIQFSQKNITLIKSIEKNIIAYMDKSKVKHLLANLLSNSYRYTDENGSVSVTLKKDNDEIILEIKDDGRGISKDDLPNIFERFYRADKSRSKQTGGLGIGLTIVKKIVDLYNGNIQVESEQNLGTTFTIRFPKQNKK